MKKKLLYDDIAAKLVLTLQTVLGPKNNNTNKFKLPQASLETAQNELWAGKVALALKMVRVIMLALYF